jgi:hypothetical protein
MQGKSAVTRGRAQWWWLVRDVLLGLALFGLLAAALGGAADILSLPRASAADVLAQRALEATAPPGPDTDNAVLNAVIQGTVPTRGRIGPTDFAVLGLTFSLMFAFNLGLWSHLRRVYASPRRGGWRRGR